eukprot:CAMPEP_0197518942 /NCGR_PEP_ID=MMETSP1318-20131121/4206_1 /TAXON_ID=552666 /ORGANISM="Partenskyella glossopodia, Strain RCC365" /LENGTH=462 /DNA_ID=CAMNT_0043069653 /DNA_START=497 /DNA_END=1885 /DNA_ORIENTATION=-
MTRTPAMSGSYKQINKKNMKQKQQKMSEIPLEERKEATEGGIKFESRQARNINIATSSGKETDASEVEKRGSFEVDIDSVAATLSDVNLDQSPSDIGGNASGENDIQGDPDHGAQKEGSKVDDTAVPCPERNRNRNRFALSESPPGTPQLARRASEIGVPPLDINAGKRRKDKDTKKAPLNYHKIYGYGPLAPLCCPTRLIKFRNRVLADFIPDSKDKSFCEKNGRRFTDFAREGIRYADLLDATEQTFPQLPSLIFGPKNAYVGALYCGAYASSEYEAFLKYYCISTIVICSHKINVADSCFKLWRKHNIRVHYIELDSNVLEEELECCDLTCLGAKETRVERKFMIARAPILQVLRVVTLSLDRGGVLLIDDDGYELAPALATFYLAYRQKLSYDEAFQIVKARRRKARFNEGIAAYFRFYLKDHFPEAQLSREIRSSLGESSLALGTEHPISRSALTPD